MRKTMVDASWSANPWVWAITFKRVGLSDSSALPVIFSGDRVLAILDGRKTQTRRVIKPHRKFPEHNICKPDCAAGSWSVWLHCKETERVGVLQECPYGKVGSLLWVKENFSLNFGRVVYRSTEPYFPAKQWRSSLFMQRWASRLMLQITEVRAQRVQDISKEDARAEGCDSCTPYDQFRALWDSINTKRRKISA